MLSTCILVQVHTYLVSPLGEITKDEGISTNAGSIMGVLLNNIPNTPNFNFGRKVWV